MIPFYLQKILNRKLLKTTNNRHFYTDIYPIFPQVLFYHVRVFDVCGALQYFNVLSPPPSHFGSSLSLHHSLSDVWSIATLFWQPRTQSPDRMHCDVSCVPVPDMSHSGSGFQSLILDLKKRCRAPRTVPCATLCQSLVSWEAEGRHHLNALPISDCSGPCPWSQTKYPLNCLTFPI